MVAIYTGHYTKKPLQNQHIAYSNDRGRTWTKFAGNPVLDIGEKDFRDPKVMWHEPTKHWVMTVSWPTHRQVRFYASPNLKGWTHLSDFGPAGSTNGIWECPDLFPLAVENQRGAQKWTLIVNVGSGAPAGGSGCQYFVGDFDGKKFTLDESFPKGKDAALWADFGPDFYAAVSWSDIPKRDGRRLWLGWMSNWQYANDVPTTPWRSAMSIAREVNLHQTPEGIRLAQQPVREQEKLRGQHYHFNGGSLAAANAWLKKNKIEGNKLELVVELDAPKTGTQGIKVLTGAREATVIGVDFDHARLFVDRTQSGRVDFHPKFSGIHDAPLAPRDGRVKLQIFVDACSVEVFASNGEVVITDVVFPAESSRGVECFGAENATKIHSLDVWQLKSAWR
jgi:fructan beta-fructosidase